MNKDTKDDNLFIHKRKRNAKRNKQFLYETEGYWQLCASKMYKSKVDWSVRRKCVEGCFQASKIYMNICCCY